MFDVSVKERLVGADNLVPARFLTGEQWLEIQRRVTDDTKYSFFFPPIDGGTCAVQRPDGSGFLVKASGAVTEIDTRGRPIR